MKAAMKSLSPILATIAIVLLVGGYVAAYLGLGTTISIWPDAYGRKGTVERTYSQQWLCAAFKPAAWIESKWTGHQVYTLYQSGTSPQN